MEANSVRKERVSTLRCPRCDGEAKRVLDSRKIGIGVRRRRECVNGHRYTTHEQIVQDYSRFVEVETAGRVAVDMLRLFANELEHDLHLSQRDAPTTVKASQENQ